MRSRVTLAAAVACALLVLATPPAHAAKQCNAPPVGKWEPATPAEAGMDGDKLTEALRYGTSSASFAIRVYRHGCRVASDVLAPGNENAQYESWSLAKSLTALVFGRAMTLGLISPDDPLGSLIPEADRPHGAITLRDLLTMTSGLHWNGLRDYDIAMPDRLHEALTVPVVKKPGTYWEYSQSGPALIAEAVQRAIGEDFQAFAQRELFGPIGIAPGSWRWTRDQKGHTQGFFGMNMVPDDFARFGELMRRGGVWNGRRLLSRRFGREAVTPVDASGCYGWLIWLNAAKPCVGVRVSGRSVSDKRSYPDLPTDMYTYNGLFGQIVTVFPSLGLVVQRSGLDPSIAGGANWEGEMYKRILGSVTDRHIPRPPDAADARSVDRSDPDRNFLTALAEPDQVLAPWIPPPLPPAGPARARAPRLVLGSSRASRKGDVLVRLTCPARWPGREPQPCQGTATLAGARAPVAYDVAAGATQKLRFHLAAKSLRALRGAPRSSYAVTAVNRDAADGTAARLDVTVARPRSLSR